MCAYYNCVYVCLARDVWGIEGEVREYDNKEQREKEWGKEEIVGGRCKKGRRGAPNEHVLTLRCHVKQKSFDQRKMNLIGG